jgi:serine/threonine protein kinase
LIKKLLTVDPKSRISAEEALQHPWIKKYHSKDKALEATEAALDNLRNFRTEKKM